MDTATFIEVLESHEIPSQGVYEDLSEIGKVLWHDDNLAIKIVCAVEGHPRVSLVALGPDDQYHFFEADLGGFSGSEVSELVSHVKEHSVRILRAAIQAEEFLCISAAGNKSKFKKV